MISLIKVMVVGGRKNADFCEYRNKNGSYRRNYFICKKTWYTLWTWIEICKTPYENRYGERGEFFMKKYENFCASLENMKDIYNYEEPYDNVVLTGLVGLYEITFEQSWKMMKEIM